MRTTLAHLVVMGTLLGDAGLALAQPDPGDGGEVSPSDDAKERPDNPKGSQHGADRALPPPPPPPAGDPGPLSGTMSTTPVTTVEPAPTIDAPMTPPPQLERETTEQMMMVQAIRISPFGPMRGHLLIEGSTVNIGLAKDSAGKPISFAPTIRYGVTNAINVGITHDGGSTWLTPRPSPGAGICVSGDTNGCAKVYNNLGLDVMAGTGPLVLHAGLDATSLDPVTLSARVGVIGTYKPVYRLSVVYDPRIGFGLNHRDPGTGTGTGTATSKGNKEYVDVPVWVWFRATNEVGVYGLTGIRGPFSHFGDGYQIPLGAGVAYRVNAKLALGFDAWFPNLVGADGSIDARSIDLRVQYAL